MSVKDQNPYADSNRQNLIWLLVGSGLLVAMLAFGFGSGYLRLPFGQNVAGLQKPGSGPQPSLEKPAASLPPVLMDTNKPEPLLEKEAKRMPPDILDWLRHLEETERRRVELVLTQESEIMNFGNQVKNLGTTVDKATDLANGEDVDLSENPASQGHQLTKDTASEWSELITFFKSQTPPTECVPIFNAYSTSLIESKAQSQDVGDILRRASEGDVSALADAYRKTGKSKGIDQADIHADKLLGEICSKYETRKWFEIKEDIGPSGFSLPGFP